MPPLLSTTAWQQTGTPPKPVTADRNTTTDVRCLSIAPLHGTRREAPVDELNMLTFTKQVSILIAVALGVMLCVPLLVPTFYGLSTITLEHAGDQLRHLCERIDVGGDHGDAQSRTSRRL